MKGKTKLRGKKKDKKENENSGTINISGSSAGNVDFTKKIRIR